LRAPNSAHATAFADDYIRGGVASSQTVASFIEDFTDMYTESATANDNTQNENVANITAFFESFKLMAQRFQSQTSVETNLKAKQADNEKEVVEVEKEIERIKSVEIGRYKEKIEIFEQMLLPRPAGTKTEEGAEPVKRAPKTNRLKKFISDSLEVLYTNLGPAVRAAIATPLVWFMLLFFIFDSFFYGMVLYDQINVLPVSLLFIAIFSGLSVGLPYALAKHVDEGRSFIVVCEIALSVLILGVTVAISYFYRNRFEGGNQALLSLGFALAPLVLGVIIGYSWHVNFQGKGEGEAA
jgi:hypothetical protein